VLEFVYGTEPLHLVNGYGLFAVMITSRLEIIIQGSNDGQTWQDYEFKDKPGDPRRRPPWVEPFQPRLDWQMWFAALGSYSENRWFVNVMVLLLEGSPEVLHLLAKDPFPDRPPLYVRAVAYDYHFANFAERRATGDWWRRELTGIYFPPASLRR
jgi:lipase maturation factor 1